MNAEITRFTNDEYQPKLNEIKKLKNENSNDTKLYALNEAAKRNQIKLDALNLIKKEILANNAKINEERTKLESITDKNERNAINIRITQYSLNIKKNEDNLELLLTKPGDNPKLTIL